MKEILEKFLTDKAARGPAEIEAFAATQENFLTWVGE